MGRAWQSASPRTAHKQGEGRCRSSSQKVGLGWWGLGNQVGVEGLRRPGSPRRAEGWQTEDSSRVKTLGVRPWWRRASLASQ